MEFWYLYYLLVNNNYFYTIGSRFHFHMSTVVYHSKYSKKQHSMLDVFLHI